MKYIPFFIITTLFCSSAVLHAKDKKHSHQKPKEQQKEASKIIEISESFGHLIGKNLESIGVELDVQAIVKGLTDSAAGKSAPMTEVECIQAIASAQEAAFEEAAEKNLSKAEEFLKNNVSEQGIIVCEEGKVQYKVEKEGSGETLKEGDVPLLQYTGKFLDGSVFGCSAEPEPFALDEVISGLKTGLLGMKEGEKRTVFIHPDHAYGSKGSLPPNSLLTFEVELLKTQAPIAAEASLGNQPSSAEIAIPDQPIENVR